MKTLDISEQMQILQLLCTHVQNCFTFSQLEVKTGGSSKDRRASVQLIVKPSLDLTEGMTKLLNGFGQLQDFGLMQYSARDWENGISDAWKLLKESEIQLDLEKALLGFHLPLHTAHFEGKIKEFLQTAEKPEFKFCSIQRLWIIAWRFTESNLCLEKVVVSEDRLFQFEIIHEDAEESETSIEECLKGLDFLAKVPDNP